MVGLLLFLLCSSAASMRVFKSNISLEDDGLFISGLKLVDNRRVSITDFTVCLRFNFQLLGTFEGRSRIITIEDWRETADVNMIT